MSTKVGDTGRFVIGTIIRHLQDGGRGVGQYLELHDMEKDTRGSDLI